MARPQIRTYTQGDPMSLNSWSLRRTWSTSRLVRSALLPALLLFGVGGNAAAQVCPADTVASDLRRPIGIALSNQGNLIISETGTAVPNSGRISIISPDGNRRTLIDRLPSGPSDVGDPAGPAGIVMRGRTLYVLMSIGDSVLPAPGFPTRQLVNPAV